MNSQLSISFDNDIQDDIQDGGFQEGLIQRNFETDNDRYFKHPSTRSTRPDCGQ